uniref:Uncharacterized protein n=1 Tax=Siphoviridae sp. ctv4j104 TaxID=2826510 RepID=A0A8S5MA50_9CAUD|nr:MAG TPA: hypothetical protein [Siphoviridae sp. ctv4j104]
MKDISQIADYCVREGLENTEDGSWTITFDEVWEHFNVDLSCNHEVRDELIKILRVRDEIADIVATEDEFEIEYN